MSTKEYMDRVQWCEYSQTIRVQPENYCIMSHNETDQHGRGIWTPFVDGALKGIELSVIEACKVMSVTSVNTMLMAMRYRMMVHDRARTNSVTIKRNQEAQGNE